MADLPDRVPQNVAGHFYVDSSCIYCDLCVRTAPSVFREENYWGWASVFHQPSTPEEWQGAWDAVESCPTESIGTDGAGPSPLSPNNALQRTEAGGGASSDLHA